MQQWNSMAQKGRKNEGGKEGGKERARAYDTELLQNFGIKSKWTIKIFDIPVVEPVT